MENAINNDSTEEIIEDVELDEGETEIEEAENEEIDP